MAHHAGIKSITGQSNSLGSENGSFARADSKQREVAGAAAEVSNDDEFVVVQRTRVEVSGSDRFILELDRADACLFERRAKPAERKLTVFIVIRIGIADGRPTTMVPWSGPNCCSAIARRCRRKIVSRSSIEYCRP